MVPSSPHSSVSSAADHTEDPGVAPPYPQSDLEALISHLVAAKRSLSSINHVWRANEIVTAARAALEESVIISGRTGFLRRGLDDQLRLLYGVKAEVEDVAHRGRMEFAASLKELDTVDARLKQTLDILRETIVEPAFRPSGEEPKSLHDFVDERGVEDLQSLLKGAIDNTNAAQADLVETNRSFDDDLRSIQQALGKYQMPSRVKLGSSSSLSSPSTSHIGVPSPSAIPELLRSLESHAQEMADLLEALVRHFDLCVTAIKHTEGGGAAVRTITGDLPTGVDVGVNIENDIDQDNGNKLNGMPEPLTDSEYREMLEVLTKDAAEAEDVVLEIQDRIAEMETTLEQIVRQRNSLNAAYKSITSIFHRLSTLASKHLPGYIAQAHAFTRIWNVEHERMKSGMADLTELRSLYIGFLDAYDGLIIEAARRKAVRIGVEKVLQEARGKLDRLFEEDVRAREAFRTEQGDYLPSDIWPGLSGAPMRVEFTRVAGSKLERVAYAERQQVEGQEGEDMGTIPSTTAATTWQHGAASGGGDSIPDLPKHVVEKALGRLKMRAKGARGPPA